MADLMKPVDPPEKQPDTRAWYKKKRFIVAGAVAAILLLPAIFGDGSGALEGELAEANVKLDKRTSELEASLAAQEDLEAQLEQLHESVAQLEERIVEQEALEQEIAELRQQYDEVLARLLLEIGGDLEAAVEAEVARACAMAVERGDADAATIVAYETDWNYVTDERAVTSSATECAEGELARIAEEEAERERQEEEARRQADEEAEAQRQRDEEEARRQQEAAEAEASRDQGVVHPGAFCSPVGATGVTSAGTPMECKTTPEDSRARWRQR